MRRLILVPLLIFIALGAILGGILYWVYNNYMFYTTDDAQLSGKIVSVSAPITGTLSTLSVKLGDTITQGQTLGTVTGAPTTGTNGAQGTPASVDITSPISGTVLQVPAVQGQGVAPGLTVVQVTDLNNINVTTYVDENSISNLKVGQNVDIKVDAYSDTSFPVHVHQIVPAAPREFQLVPTPDNAISTLHNT